MAKPPEIPPEIAEVIPEVIDVTKRKIIKGSLTSAVEARQRQKAKRQTEFDRLSVAERQEIIDRMDAVLTFKPLQGRERPKGKPPKKGR